MKYAFDLLIQLILNKYQLILLIFYFDCKLNVEEKRGKKFWILERLIMVENRLSIQQIEMDIDKSK
jgi:hypothetical protein